MLKNLLQYLEKEVKLGTKVNHIMRHTVGLYHGQIGSKKWKRYLSDNMMARDSDFQKAKHIMTIVQNNEKLIKPKLMINFILSNEYSYFILLMVN